MCDPCGAPHRLTRRRLLAGVPLAGLAATVALPAPPANAGAPVAAGLEVLPREAWAAGLAPAGPIPAEPDVRVLLVHHSVSPNSYAEDDVPGLLRTIHRFHTGERGWPDVAYNFFVDRFGRVWEGRAGSIGAQVAGDATGGNQGHSQLACFLGEHSHEPPPEAALASMGRLLGWLGDRAGIDVRPGATTRFTSRGSNLHPAGTEVTASTIAGHRAMSRTACPGDAAQALIDDGTIAALAAAASTRSATTPAPPPTAPATTTTEPTVPPPTTGRPAAPPDAGASPGAAATGPDGGGVPLWAVGSGTAAVAGIGAAVAAVIRRRRAVAAPRRSP